LDFSPIIAPLGSTFNKYSEKFKEFVPINRFNF
jgi:hypothetical protein